MLPMLDLQRKSVEFPEAGRIGSWKLEGLEAGRNGGAQVR
jgi:hypothetical protein